MIVHCLCCPVRVDYRVGIPCYSCTVTETISDPTPDGQWVSVSSSHETPYHPWEIGIEVRATNLPVVPDRPQASIDRLKQLIFPDNRELILALMLGTESRLVKLADRLKKLGLLDNLLEPGEEIGDPGYFIYQYFLDISVATSRAIERRHQLVWPISRLLEFETFSVSLTDAKPIDEVIFQDLKDRFVK